MIRNRCEAENGQSGWNVAGKLSKKARERLYITKLALEQSMPSRIASIFLGQSKYDRIREHMSLVKGSLYMEALPRFIANQGGELVDVWNFNSIGERLVGQEFIEDVKIANPIIKTKIIDGQVRSFLYRGIALAYFGDESVVISASVEHAINDNLMIIEICSNGNAGDFAQRWKKYIYKDNYLRGQAFFADSEVIERERTYSWDDVCISQDIKLAIHTHVEVFLTKQKRLKALGLKGRRGLILAGKPGTGKTLIGKVLADTLPTSFIWVLPAHIQTPNSFKDIVSVARLVAPVVLFWEDIDLFAEDRNTHRWLGLGELMNQLDGAVDNEGIVTIATTNQLDVIENALRNRPGRFDRVVHIDDMDVESRTRLLRKLLSKAKIATKDFEYILDQTDGYTGAQVEEFVNTLYILAISDEDVSDDIANQTIIIDRNIIERAFKETAYMPREVLGFQGIKVSRSA